MELKGVAIQAVGNVSLTENDSIDLIDYFKANAAVLRAEGTVQNFEAIELQVARTAEFHGGSISIGEQDGDQISITSIVFQSLGHVSIETDSDLLLTQSSRAGAASIRSDGAVNGWRFASAIIDGNATFAGSQLSIGEFPEDTFYSGSLTFISDGDVVLSQDRDTLLDGTSRAGHAIIQSTGNVEDHELARLSIEKSIYFKGVDLIIGELASDCFQLLSGEDGLMAEGSGTINIVPGC